MPLVRRLDGERLQVRSIPPEHRPGEGAGIEQGAQSRRRSGAVAVEAGLERAQGGRKAPVEGMGRPAVVGDFDEKVAGAILQHHRPGVFGGGVRGVFGGGLVASADGDGRIDQRLADLGQLLRHPG